MQTNSPDVSECFCQLFPLEDGGLVVYHGFVDQFSPYIFFLSKFAVGGSGSQSPILVFSGMLSSGYVAGHKIECIVVLA